MKNNAGRGYSFISATVRFAYRFISDFFLPQFCLNCGILLNTNKDNYICVKCRPLVFRQIDNAICFKCGKELTNKNISKQIPENLIRCRLCVRQNPHFDFCRHIFVYENHIRTLIKKFKYNFEDELAELFAGEMFEYIKTKNNIFSNKIFDCITNIPIHNDRLKIREFDHIDLLCAEFSRLANIKYLKNLLLKIRNTNQQANLKRKDRLTNVKNSFSVNKEFLPVFDKLKNILLVDDVYSTGATINECSRELKKIKPELIIYGLTIARGT